MSTVRKNFGIMPDGTNVDCCVLERGDMKVTLIEYGARIADINYKGVQTIGGFDTLEGYLTDTEHQGSTVGRYANRIKDGIFYLNGEKYVLAKNEKGVNFYKKYGFQVVGTTPGVYNDLYEMEKYIGYERRGDLF
jgi:aldose 1-epimerase